MDSMNMNTNTKDRFGARSSAMAYVEWQYFSVPYEPQKALQVGTIFPELDKPFLGRKAGYNRK